MERKFKHKLTNKILVIGGKTGESMLKYISSKYDGITISEIITNSNEWEEIVEYPIGTKVYNSQTKTIYTKKEDGWYKPAEKTTYTDEMISSKEHLTVLSKSEEIVDKNPLKLEVGKEYILQYIHCKSKPQHVKITRFTSDGYPWQERVSDGGLKGIVSPGSYKLIEEVVEKDYEILTYRNFITGVINSISKEFLSNEGYRQFTVRDLDIINEPTRKKVYHIHSIKRLSDGEVFTIGDKAITKYSNYGNITEFELKYNKIYITTELGKNRCYLNDLKSIKKPFEKDYEILSLTSIESPTRGEKILWYFDKENNGWTVDEPERAYYKDIPDFTNIHSVRRKSDGEVFTIGDKINYKVVSTSKGKRTLTSKINSFYIDLNNNLRVNFDLDRINISTNCYLNDLLKVKNPLFTTEDGIDIYEGDKCWGVIDTYPWKVYQVNTKNDLDWIHKLTFSTKEAAEKYINSRKPYLSNKDVLDEIEKCTNIQQLKKVFTNKVAY